MCCDECPTYEKCAEEDRLKDECCKKCPDYDDCAGLNSKDCDGESNFDFDENF